MTKPFKIDAPGFYLRTVEVAPSAPDHSEDPWVWREGEGSMNWNAHGHRFTNGTRSGDSAWDIIAKAPAPASKPAPEPAKGKKAKRRYVVRRATKWGKGYWILDAETNETAASGMSSADARRVCAMLNGAAMKEAQRGGA